MLKRVESSCGSSSRVNESVYHTYLQWRACEAMWQQLVNKVTSSPQTTCTDKVRTSKNKKQRSELNKRYHPFPYQYHHQCLWKQLVSTSSNTTINNYQQSNQRRRRSKGQYKQTIKDSRMREWVSQKWPSNLVRSSHHCMSQQPFTLHGGRVGIRSWCLAVRLVPLGILSRKWVKQALNTKHY